MNSKNFGIPLKQWMIEKAILLGVSRSTVYNRLKSGEFGVGIRKVNKRVVYVCPKEKLSDRKCIGCAGYVPPLYSSYCPDCIAQMMLP